MQDLQAGRHRELHQLGTGIDQEIDEREVALGWGIDLVQPIDCARLSFHGGSLLAGLRPGLVTGRIARPVRSRRLKFQQLLGHLRGTLFMALISSGPATNGAHWFESPGGYQRRLLLQEV